MSPPGKGVLLVRVDQFRQVDGGTDATAGWNPTTGSVRQLLAANRGAGSVVAEVGRCAGTRHGASGQLALGRANLSKPAPTSGEPREPQQRRCDDNDQGGHRESRWSHGL